MTPRSICSNGHALCQQIQLVEPRIEKHIQAAVVIADIVRYSKLALPRYGVFMASTASASASIAMCSPSSSARPVQSRRRCADEFGGQVAQRPPVALCSAFASLNASVSSPAINSSRRTSARDPRRLRVRRGSPAVCRCANRRCRREVGRNVQAGRPGCSRVPAGRMPEGDPAADQPIGHRLDCPSPPPTITRWSQLAGLCRSSASSPSSLASKLVTSMLTPPKQFLQRLHGICAIGAGRKAGLERN